MNALVTHVKMEVHVMMELTFIIVCALVDGKAIGVLKVRKLWNILPTQGYGGSCFDPYHYESMTLKITIIFVISHFMQL